MSEELEIILNSSAGEVECFLDPDNEVFFGPVTEREREIRRPLPRKTLHPCEITQISKRGMTFKEWEDFKDQVHRNQLNDEAIKEVYGLDPDTTEESFTSCRTSGEEGGSKQASSEVETSLEQSWEKSLDGSNSEEKNQQDLSGVGSLNDTWEIQERMLALAEKLERGEDIPELGICRHASGAIEYKERGSKSQMEDSVKILSNEHPQYDTRSNENDSKVVVEGKKQEQEDVVRNMEQDVSESGSINNGSSDEIGPSTLQDRKTKSVEELAKEMDCLFLAETLVETPVKESALKVNNRVTPSVAGSYSSSHIVLETPIKTPSGLSIKHRSTPIQSDSMKKPAPKPSVKSKNSFVASSPVGMYIRSLPEPILIENVRSAQKKRQLHSSPMVKPIPVAVKNKEGRWSVARTSRNSTAAAKENVAQLSDFTDFKPVLPSVLHEAAATLIDERHMTTSPRSAPGIRGKIGKLLERGVTPTVMKHSGRIQISKDSVNSSKIIQSPMSARFGAQTNLMEVSVLETVGSANTRSPRNPAFARK